MRDPQAFRTSSALNIFGKTDIETSASGRLGEQVEKSFFCELANALDNTLISHKGSNLRNSDVRNKSFRNPNIARLPPAI